MPKGWQPNVLATASIHFKKRPYLQDYIFGMPLCSLLSTILEQNIHEMEGHDFDEKALRKEALRFKEN